MTRYRVTAPKVEVRVHGVLTSHFYGEAVELDEAAARPLVAAGALTAVPPAASLPAPGTGSTT